MQVFFIKKYKKDGKMPVKPEYTDFLKEKQNKLKKLLHFSDI